MPLQIRLQVVEKIIRFITFCVPRYKKIARLNLARAFPDRDLIWRETVLSESHTALARLLVDFLDLHKNSKKQIEFKLKSRLLELVGQRKPIVFATGHLGSFELLAHYLANIGVPLAFVARQLRPPQLDRWWTARREANGNSVISRSGALKGTLRYLQNGKAVGVLFDQNITRQHAAFVDWFGYPAATSRLVGISAVRSNAVVIVISMQHLYENNYQVNAKEMDFNSLYNNENLTSDEKILEITRQVSQEYVEMIRKNPKEWFWMHRRWKTAALREDEKFYDGI